MSATRRILITGASSSVARALRPFLQQDYLLRLQSFQQILQPESASEECFQANIEDLAALVDLATGVDAIIHLAADSNAYATWEEVRGPNIDGTYNIFEAARLAGVPKVIFASSNHAMGMYDRDQAWPIHPEQPIRPDGYYGVSKAFGEALGRFYADAFDISIICLRIGWVLEHPQSDMQLRMWLSARDLGQLMRLCLQTEQRFGIYYGVSNNQRNKWDIENARRELGYHPDDDSERFATLASAPESGSTD